MKTANPYFLYLTLDLSESIFFKTRYLSLRNTDLVCDLHLCFSEEEAQVQYVFFPC